MARLEIANANKSECFLLDANVFIAYTESEYHIFKLVHKHIGSVKVLPQIFREVTGLDISICRKFNIEIVEPTEEQLDCVVERESSRLSNNDYLCYLVAKDLGCTCVTNDKSLRKFCNRQVVDTIWGPDLLIHLIKVKALSVDNALQTAKKIHNEDPDFFSIELLNKFERNARQLETKVNRQEDN